MMRSQAAVEAALEHALRGNEAHNRMHRHFLIFLVVSSQTHPAFKSGHLISKYTGFLSIVDINFPF